MRERDCSRPNESVLRFWWLPRGGLGGGVVFSIYEMRHDFVFVFGV